MTIDPEDLAWIARFLAGEEAAFAWVVERYQQGTLRHAHAVLGHLDQAWDVVQEAFIEAYEHRAELREQAAFPVWLRRIVRTRISRLRRGKTGDALPDDLESAAQSPEADLDARQQRQLIAVAVADLPQHERVVVHLFYLAGTSQDEIARTLGIPLNTVKTRLHSARARLGDRLLGLLDGSAPLPGAQASLEFVQRVRLFRALDQRDLATMTLLVDAAPNLVHEFRARADDHVAGVRWGLTALHLAARAGDVAIAQLLLEHGANLEASNRGPDAPQGATPLYLAVANGRLEMTRMLLACGARPTGHPGADPLRAAIVHARHPKIAHLLIAAGAEVDIFVAVALDDMPRVEGLLNADPGLVHARLNGEVRGDNPATHTPLHVAARNNLSAMARLLVACGGDLAARDAMGRTPVDQALAWGHAETFRVLVTLGGSPSAALVAEVGSVERAGTMVRLLACLFERNLEDARGLLDRDPSLANARLPTFWPDNHVGGTAMHLAAWLDLRPFIDLLLEYGADPTIRDQRYGGTPSSWARENSQDQAAEYLDRIAKHGPRGPAER
jgi:RNA polymerase sigma factor (sigma-70 family)